MWRALRAAAQPETRGAVPAAQVLTIRLAAGADAARVTAAASARLAASAVTRDQAMLAIPGASAMRSTLGELIAAVLVVALLVTALFAALNTAERRGELARLRALGAPTRRLCAGLLIQVEVPIVIAVAAAYLITAALLAVAPPDFPVALPLSRALYLAALILLAGLLGTVGGLAGVLRADPVTTGED